MSLTAANERVWELDRLALYRRDVSLGVGNVVAVGQVEQHEDVAERVRYDGYAADGNVEGFGDHSAAGGLNGRDRVVGGGDEPVRFVILLGCQDDLGVGAGKCQAGLADGNVAPSQLVTERIAVKAQARVKIWYRDRDRIDLLEQ